jgi:hypothetical protein
MPWALMNDTPESTQQASVGLNSVDIEREFGPARDAPEDFRANEHHVSSVFRRELYHYVV